MDLQAEDTEKKLLLADIKIAAEKTAPRLNRDWTLTALAYRAGERRRFWRGRKVHLGRIYGLSQPLWLGVDGVIYRGYGKNAGTYPDYCMVAEIEKRTLEGLARVLDALNDM